ncbi:MAG: glycosyltransferase family 4 protein [Anaerolineae bacterium]|nr:glycosyltransferase family 4 protein [Anaerolineae bacterium]
MYQFNVPEVSYSDPWASTYAQQIQNLSRNGFRIAYYYDEPDNSTFRYRVYNMIQVFTESTLPVSAAYFTRRDSNYMDEVLKITDVLVICRSKYTDKLDHMVMRAKSRGIPVLYDIDDFVFDTHAVHLLVDTLQQPRNEADWDFWFAYFARNGSALRLCDGAITTNAFLAKRLHDFAGIPVHVIPNFLNEEQLAISDRIYQQKQSRHFARDGKIHLGYFSGSPSHNKDFKIILAALSELLQSYPQVVLRIAGYIDLKEALKSFTDQVEYLPFTDFINLQRYIGSTEINMVPLQDNEFTNCKSQLKYFEAGVVGTVTVASPIFTYRESIEHGKNGYLANSYQWFDILANLIENIDTARPIIEAAYKHSLEQFAWYNQIQRLEQVFLTNETLQSSSF